MFCNTMLRFKIGTDVAICEPTDSTVTCSLRKLAAREGRSEQLSSFCEPTHSALGDLARGTARSLAPTAQNLSRVAVTGYYCCTLSLAGTGREVRARCDGRQRTVETRAGANSAQIGRDCECH